MVSLFAWLQYGIKIEKITILDNKIHGLYLKLDKKLILDINEIDIKTSLEQEVSEEGDTSAKQTADIAQNIKLLLDYFEEIDIQSIKYQNYEGSIKFNDEDLLLDTDDISLAANFHVEKDLIIVSVDSLLAKKFKINTFGTLVYNLKNKQVNYGGQFIISPDIAGSIAINSDLKSAKIDLTSEIFSSLAPLKKLIPLASTDAREWTFDKVQPQQIKLNRCSIYVKDLDKPEDIGKNDLYVDFTAQNADVKFQSGLPAAKAPKITGTLKNNDFLFNIYGGSYQGIRFDTLRVLIGDIFTDGRSALYLDLNTKAPLNKNVADVLNAYKVNMPVLQTKGTTDAQVKLHMPFSTLEPSVSGVFTAKDATYKIGSFEFFTKNADVTLDNTDITVKKSSFIVSDLLNTLIEGNMDLRSGIFKNTAFINSFKIETGGEQIVTIKDKTVNSVLDFSDGSNISLAIPQFRTSLHFKDKANAIFVDKLALMYPYSKMLQDFGVSSGYLKIFTKNFENFNIEGAIYSEKIPLIKNGVPVKNFKLTADIAKEGARIKSADNLVRIDINKIPTIYVDAYDINITKKLIDGDGNKSSGTQNTGKYPTFKMYASHSNIFFKERKFLADKFSVDSFKQGMNINFQYKKGNGFIQLADNYIKIAAHGFDDKFVSTAAKREFADGGVFSLYAETKKSGLDGNFSFNGTTLKNLKSLNNMLAVFDTIPSLVIFKNPGFNEEGYQVNNGNIDFILTDANMLILKKIFIDGTTMDINGSGYVNLNNDQLNMPLQVTTMKSLSTIIDAIPIVNYILLGKDGSINVGVEVNGTINDPKVHTTTLEDVAASPFRIIKRILETPFRIFE